MSPGLHDSPGLGKNCVLSSGIMLSNSSDIGPSEVSTHNFEGQE